MDAKEAWYKVESDIVWPPSVSPIQRKVGSLAHGETWIVQDESMSKYDELQKKKEKINFGIQHIEKVIQEIVDKIEEFNEADSLMDRNDEWNQFEQFRLNDLNSPTGHDQSEKLREFSRARQKDFSNMDPESLARQLEEKRQTKVQLEDKKDLILNEIQLVENTNFKCELKFKETPSQLSRLDAPWIQFPLRQSRVSSALPDKTSFNPSENSNSVNETNASSSKLRLDLDDPSLEKNPKPRLFSVKLLSPGIPEASDGRRFITSFINKNSRESIRPLVREGEELLSKQWEVLQQHDEGERQKACISPLIAVLPIQHSNHQDFHEVGFFSTYFPVGSVYDIVSKFSGKRGGYKFKSTMILENLKNTIKTMASLERLNVIHGSIHPSNIFISNDGYTLLLAEFLPKSEIRRWFSDLQRGITNVPQYLSPELYQKLVIEKNCNIDTLETSCNLHKHDVFCLGLAYYFLTLRKISKNIYRSSSHLKEALRQLRKEITAEELVDYLSRMLTYNPKNRPTFYDLLTLSEKALFTGENILSGMKSLVGF
ncbi:probable inactive serine/threonine-protein kinase DDB_G0280131 [Hylaeus volcanicus]|uniref:probable inactive serine/threonine-protein kinase DDB_G0280131 n=1 Tax=Hylaeus volcanicus TaxID=313075 RepID=UPI0023B79F51|nr:probable inactive serine/threonine-protein kinase DDB_G0280131 [Hylaeus volcanicus]